MHAVTNWGKLKVTSVVSGLGLPKIPLMSGTLKLALYQEAINGQTSFFYAYGKVISFG